MRQKKKKETWDERQKGRHEKVFMMIQVETAFSESAIRALDARRLLCTVPVVTIAAVVP